MASRKKNPNDRLLKDVKVLNDEIVWKKYEHMSAFRYLCKINPVPDRERIEIGRPYDDENIRTPCVYIIVIEGKIFKIGVAAGTKNVGGFAGRIGSYNCGTLDNRIRGTASTTNYWVLQSLLRMNKTAEVYALYSKEIVSEIFGEKFTDWVPSPKGMETVIIRQFEKRYGKKPIGNTQG